MSEWLPGRSRPLRVAARYGRELHRQLRKELWEIEGRERTSGASLKIIFSGQLESKCFITNLLFADDCHEQRRPAWSWDIARLALDPSRGHALAFVEHERYPVQSRQTFHIPCWIGGEIDVANAMGLQRTSSSLKGDLQRIRSRKIDFTIERSPQALLRFYDEMYVPYVRATYGPRAFVTSRAEFIGKLSQAELLLVRRNGESIAGCTLLYEGNRMRAWCAGVKNGDRRYVRDGGLAAIYYYQIAYCHGKGIERLHVGASRPFLNDGVLCVKRKWGMQMVDWTPKWFALTCLRYSPGATAFLANNPFVHEIDGKCHGAVFVDGASNRPSATELNALRLPGLHGMTVFRSSAGEAAGGEWLQRLS